MSNFQPNQEVFEKNYNIGKTQLVYSWIPADLTTPVAAYLKICGRNPNSFLLESIEGGEILGRYSIIGVSPDLIWKFENGDTRLWHNYGTWEISNDAPLDALRKMLKDCHIDIQPEDAPPMAVSGLFGYMGYDMVRLAENIQDDNPDPINIPDSIMMRPTILVIFDNVKNMMCIVTPVYEHGKNDSGDAQEIYKNACSRVQNILNDLRTPLLESLTKAKSTQTLPLDIQCNTSKEEYMDIVKKSVKYIKAGEIFQVVPGMRFNVPFDIHSFELYRSLRRVNPSPFMFHFQFENFSLVGASPEILVRVRDNTVTIRPLAGTRKRGTSPAEDKANADDLLSDPKELAEHLMLLDLGRNDVGRVSKISTVEVTDEFVVEYYSHVMHIVSNVEGQLQTKLDILDALFAGFPAGTVSGAPKVRAMEIIEELEKERRSYYGGCIGYLSGNGDMDTCIALRTSLIKDGKLYIQAGAGVVADSNPESEYDECRNKAQALIRAAELAVEANSSS